ncbi:MAG: hypothetical protein ABFS45_15300 [Pseudomonadota bacterium]
MEIGRLARRILRYSCPPDRSHYVLKVVDGELVRQPIKLGMKNHLQVEVVAGLGTEEQIVAAPSSDMEAGQAVSVEPMS